MLNFQKLFAVKPVIGMLHLGGTNPLGQAIDDYDIYQAEGLDAVIIENYHGTVENVEDFIARAPLSSWNMKIGVNVLGDFELSFSLADRYGADFIQIDSVQPPDIDVELYCHCRKEYPNLVVLGGIGFKYTTNPEDNLKSWLGFGRLETDAIVTTGKGTGKETPLEKLIEYKRVLGEFPLIEGAGSNAQTVYEHLSVADGVIVGSYFKIGGNTQLPVERKLVRTYMKEANRVRS